MDMLPFRSTVMVLSIQKKCSAAPVPSLDDTPGATDCGACLKRQRLQDGSGCNSMASVTRVQSCWAQQHPGSACASSGSAASSRDVPAAAAGTPWQPCHLLDYVQRCLRALSAMHPVTAFILTETKAAGMACALFRRVFLQRSAAQREALVREHGVAQAMLAASLWVAVKFEATRTTTPDAAIMSRITGIPSAALIDQERQVLAGAQWDLMRVAREAGAVGCVDLTDAPSQEQQTRLSALAQLARLPGAAQLAAVSPSRAIRQLAVLQAGALPMHAASNLLRPCPAAHVPQYTCLSRRAVQLAC